MKIYPDYNPDNAKELPRIVRFIQQERKNDVNDFTNLNNRFISGRKVARIPSSSADVIRGDVVGDFNVTDTYAYFLIDNSGTAEWRRVAVGSW